MIGIVDYGLGNLRSVAAAVTRVGEDPVITAEAQQLAACDKLIIPGVGAFGDAMQRIRATGLDVVLRELVMESRKPVLGICLGFQLLFEGSSEFGDHAGLGFVPGMVEKFQFESSDLRVPHVGWNKVHFEPEGKMFTDIPPESLFYFVHSYRVPAALVEEATGTCEYGEKFTAAIATGNIWGTQFHPEKSQRVGLQLLYNFVRNESW